MRDFEPRPWQPQMIDHVIEHPRSALFAGMGVGKGVAALTALDAVSLVEDDVYPALVLGTLRVARKVWSTEAAKWNHLKHLRVQKVIGDGNDRSAALRRPGDIFTLNYENLPWLVKYLGEDWPFKTVIADESTRLKNFRLKQGGVRAQALGKLAHSKVRRWVNLTGTPSPNGLKDLWGQTWFLDAGQRLGRTWEGFESRWFAYKRIRDALSHKVEIKPVIMPTADVEIHERIRDLCLSVDLADYVDLAEPMHHVVRVDLPAKVRGLYRDMEREMFMAIAGHEVEAVNAAAKTIKCLQLANGAVYVDPLADSDDHPRAREFVEVHDRKLEALGDIVGDMGGTPLLVAYQFKSDLARLLKAFPQGRALRTEQDEDDFKAGRIPLLFAHPASAGHGIDGFQNVTNAIAFFGEWWDLELRDQIIGRIGTIRQYQIGNLEPMHIYDIVAEDTVDELVLARHESKRSVQDLLLEATKRKGYA